MLRGLSVAHLGGNFVAYLTQPPASMLLTVSVVTLRQELPQVLRQTDAVLVCARLVKSKARVEPNIGATGFTLAKTTGRGISLSPSMTYVD